MQAADAGDPTSTNELHTGPEAVYRRRLRDGELAFQRCRDCQATTFPPRLRCPSCGAESLSWHSSAGRGTVYAISVLSPRNDDPYNVALIDLDEGFRMMSTVTGTSPTEAVIGDRVTLTISGDDNPIPTFELVR